MTSLLVAEQHTPQSNLYTTLHDTATVHGISLEPDRLLQLASRAQSMQASEHIHTQHGIEAPATFWDPINEVDVGPAVFSDRFGTTAAKVDFTPTVALDGDFVSGDTTARPEHATLFTFMEPISNLHPPQTDEQTGQVNNCLKHALFPLPAVA